MTCYGCRSRRTNSRTRFPLDGDGIAGGGRARRRGVSGVAAPLRPPRVQAREAGRPAWDHRTRRPAGDDRGAGPVPLIAVVAPAGYGKSMLLAQWGRGSGLRNAWISCDDGDNDPAVLLTCLAAAVAG